MASVQTWAVQCSFCFSRSYQMAGSYDLKNTDACVLWNCTDTWASGVLLLEGIHPHTVRAIGGDHGRRLGGQFHGHWCSWHITPGLPCFQWPKEGHSFLCLSGSRRFTSEDSFISLHWESFLIISAVQTPLSCYNTIQLKTACSSVVRKCCCRGCHVGRRLG